MFKKRQAQMDHPLGVVSKPRGKVGPSLWQNIVADGKDQIGRPREATRSISSFHYLMIGLIILLQIGGIIDARTHVFYGFDIQSFFVPAHYLLYGAWMLVLWSVMGYALMQIRRGRNMVDWLPPRYALAALGAILFGIAGAFDAVWHTLFGFELNLEVLLSPAHLVLFVAFGLIYFSVLSHATYQYDLSPREHQNSFLTSLPMLIGIASLFVIVFWPTWYFDPFAADYASKGAMIGMRDAYDFIDYGSPAAEIAGVGGILLTTLIVIPFVILPLYRWRLPSGSLIFILGWVFIQRAIILGVYSYLPAILGAALVGEIIWAWMRRGGETRLSSPLGYRILAFCVPLVLFSIYFLIIAFMPNGVIWPVHLWTGAIWMAALAGLLMSFTMIPQKGVVHKIG
jgi:hypothetical protein